MAAHILFTGPRSHKDTCQGKKQSPEPISSMGKYKLVYEGGWEGREKVIITNRLSVQQNASKFWEFWFLNLYRFFSFFFFKHTFQKYGLQNFIKANFEVGQRNPTSSSSYGVLLWTSETWEAKQASPMKIHPHQNCYSTTKSWVLFR